MPPRYLLRALRKETNLRSMSNSFIVLRVFAIHDLSPCTSKVWVRLASCALLNPLDSWLFESHAFGGITLLLLTPVAPTLSVTVSVTV
jgi:hypothetical protein